MNSDMERSTSKGYSSFFYRINLHRAIRSPARAGRAARLSDGMLLSREVYIKPKGAFF